MIRECGIDVLLLLLLFSISYFTAITRKGTKTDTHVN